MSNIVFIGMPGCGKTTVSRRVAELLGLSWFDSDSEIEAREGKRIPQIFADSGEEYFRARETECVKRLMKNENAVISVGGGAVIRNAGVLRPATVVYLKRDVKNIMATLARGTRPLVTDERRLVKLYGERKALYERLCDYTITNDGEIGEAVKKALEVLR